MAMSDWRSHYESAADDEEARYRRRPVVELIADVHAGRVGDYATIWRVIGERGKLAEVGWNLMAFLRSDRDYLERYHCAAALLHLMRSTAFEPVQLSAGWPAMPEHLARLEQLLTTTIGPRRSGAEP